MADQLGLKVEPSSESFAFLDRGTQEVSSETLRLCLTLIDLDIHYDPVRVVKQHVNLVEIGDDLGDIAACHCGAEYVTSCPIKGEASREGSVPAAEVEMADKARITGGSVQRNPATQAGAAKGAAEIGEFSHASSNSTSEFFFLL
ncbi:hypothetical protein Bca52824_023049 [Brassica carinata]|uniref:Uncharacterized protein n=1 Tax=Brassica carinata TaxID=52824 RepID=A0A8X7VHU4_BRACI|nr:hypothetical protein Bca52824_023049 [Brassica carinata]